MTETHNHPLSGSVDQWITAWSNWFSPTFEINFAGNRPVENKVVSNVASYGKQLGLLSEIILELAKTPDERKEGFDDLVVQLAKRVEAIELIKAQFQPDLEWQAKEVLAKLAKTDEKAFARVLEKFQKESKT